MKQPRIFVLLAFILISVSEMAFARSVDNNFGSRSLRTDTQNAELGRLISRLRSLRFDNEDVKPEDVKIEDAKIDDVIPEVVKIEDVKIEDVIPRDVKIENVKIDNVIPTDLKIEEVIPTDLKIEEVIPTDLKIENLIPNVVNIDDIKPVNVRPEDVKLTIEKSIEPVKDKKPLDKALINLLSKNSQTTSSDSESNGIDRSITRVINAARFQQMTKRFLILLPAFVNAFNYLATTIMAPVT